MNGVNKNKLLFPTVGEIVAIIADLLGKKSDRRELFRKDRLPYIIDKGKLEECKKEILPEKHKKQFENFIHEYISFIKKPEKECDIFDWLYINYLKNIGIEKNKFDIEKNKYLQKQDKKNIDLHSVYRSKGLENLYAGKYEEALEEYKKFALNIFYTGDKNAICIFIESLVLAATLYLHEKANISFFKNLKYVAILFEELGESNSNIGKKVSKDETINIGDLIGFARRFSEFFLKKNFIEEKYYLCDEYVEPILDPNCPDKKIKMNEYEYPQIVWFSSEDNIDYVEKLLEKNANANLLSKPENESALLCAIRNNNEKIFNLLIEKTELKIINAIAIDEFTCLGQAIDKWNLKITESLLVKGADIEQYFTSEQISPLYYAINKIIRSNKPVQISDFMDFIKNLSDAECEKIRKNAHGFLSGMINTEIRELCSHPFLGELVNNIFEDIKLNKDDYVPEDEKIPMIKLLLKHKANPNARQKNNDTPMKLAERNKLDNIIELFLTQRGLTLT